MDEDVEAVAITDRNNEKYIDNIEESSKLRDKDNDRIEYPFGAEENFEEDIYDPEYLYAEAIVNPNVPVAGARDDYNT